MVRRSRWRLVLAGFFLAAAPAFARFAPYLWAPSVFSALAGLYLLAWGTLGRGYWCRVCKKFNLFHTHS